MSTKKILLTILSIMILAPASFVVAAGSVYLAAEYWPTPALIAFDCTNLEEEECYSDPRCLPNIGSSSCSPDGICTTDLTFLSCYAVSDGLTAQIADAKELCATTNGEWLPNIQFNPLGECSCARDQFNDPEFWSVGDLYFLKDIGCTDEKNICTNYLEGTWNPSELISSTVKPVPQNECITGRPAYDGKYYDNWDKQRATCTTYEFEPLLPSCIIDDIPVDGIQVNMRQNDIDGNDFDF